MAKQLMYADALRILGKNDSEVLDLAEKLTDGGLGLVGVPDLFGARGALVSKGRQALEGIRGKLKGESRLSRTEKIEAAYQVLVVVAFFEAVEESLESAGAPFTLNDLDITADEQTALLGMCTRFRYSLSSQGSEWEGTSSGLVMLTDEFLGFLPGLAAVERHGITGGGHPVLARLSRVLPDLSAERLAESYRRLAADIPEFGMWVHLDEHARTRRALGTGMGELRRRLDAIGSGRAVGARRRELSDGYQAVLRKPVLGSDDVPAWMALPSLGDCYVPPRGCVAFTRRSSAPSTEDWWAEQTTVEDLQPFIAAHLVHPACTSRPTVLLGHPGSGKSTFTQILAAQLPASDFLPIRVELRAVRPNAPIHLQIEEGLAAALHTHVSWRELAESADGALPVVILDGFDELLQATGVDRSDYLERVQEFQHQQEAIGQPVAVIVTSRTVVANRTRFPPDTTVIRLEPFGEEQIGELLSVWNRANGRAFSDAGLAPLTMDVLAPYRELAEQPLLLLMLLIYDARDNALSRASGTLSHGQLYERLLTMFARREVDKLHPGLGGPALDRAVEDELRRLEIAAMAMFARGRQSVHADELDRDLSVLMPEAAQRPTDADLHGQIAPAHQVLGRFFFVHESRAQASGSAASVFEFLHATFGEYLVARAVTSALDELVEDRARSLRRRGGPQHLDDGELHALSSFAAFAGREKVVDFLDERLRQRSADDPDLVGEYTALLIELFQEAPFPAPNRSYTAYEPQRLAMSAREGRYTANLVTLLVLVARRPLRLEELFPDARDRWHAWRATVAQWRALPSSQWFGVMDTLRIRHHGYLEGRDAFTSIEREDRSPVVVGECLGFELRADVDTDPSVADPYQVTVPCLSVTSELLRSMALQANSTASRMSLILLPYLKHVSPDVGTWHTDQELGSAWIEAYEVLRLRLGPAEEKAHDRVDSYRRLLQQPRFGEVQLLALRQAAEDLALLRPGSHERSTLAEVVRHYLTEELPTTIGDSPVPAAFRPVLTLLRHQLPDLERIESEFRHR
ncbi:NACHT domain-containing protein [Nocardiopsis aegyptia]|uniref:Energy-coupling factor transporter ATP-binding protein EcfA2 n=1 Tax=Nocardiopsis aegyptia TaxID=220378 RepID=A0A7Z0J944_9ACTN|nr:NACHT domain-containing protein [Nocardiopsis aegyptia]NYJ33094.1 energy-coupling factor transporter ATP-binding protein EcfA2 [Nocardiopsis aegyptia]